MVEVVALVANKVNPQIVNPLTRLWNMINVSHLVHTFTKYLKLAKIAMMHALVSVEDERCFNFISFLKSKMRNCLNPHLQLVVLMYAQLFFTLDTFPYATTFESWASVMIAIKFG
jgi:hypothetical protein